jgi:acetylornithine/N-succinyldiaminopimelate aminotransferase
MDSNTHFFDALMDITKRPANVFVRGKGSWIWDHSGKRYLDFVQGWAVNCLGHSPDVIADAIAVQAKTLITPSPAFYNEPSLRLARMLTTLSGLDRVFFANSGGEANEGAIKLARKFGGKYRNGAYEIITFDKSFHGRTLATMSASGKKAFEPLFEPKVAGFPKAVLNDLDSVERLIGPKTVAVMLEPIQGEAGVLTATIDFLRALRELTWKHRLLLIHDEIQTGIGRTGAMFDYENADIRPDILTLGKGLGGGVPIAALLASEAVSCFEHGDQGGTFNGNPLMCAAGIAVVSEVSKPAFLEGVASRGRYLASELTKLSDKYDLGGVRGRGLLLALDLGKPIANDIVAQAFEDGLLLNAPGADCLRFMPALDVSYQEIADMISTLDRLLSRSGAGW